jgi:hypothetical protein
MRTIIANPEASSREGSPRAPVPDGGEDRLVATRMGRRVAALGHEQRRPCYLTCTQRATEGILCWLLTNSM